MTSISSATSQQFSPLSRLQSELASEVSAGTISGSDQSALSSALTDIDTAMKAGAGANDGTRPSPDAMKAKINGLIDAEVSDGKLTSDQAAELKNVFSQAFAGGPGGPGGPGGAGGGGGSSKTSTDPADTNGDGTVSAAEQAAYDAKSATTSGSSGSSDTDKLVQDFLKLLKDSSGSSSTYGASGDSLASKLKSLLVDYQV
jgi:hypothetical protein